MSVVKSSSYKDIENVTSKPIQPSYFWMNRYELFQRNQSFPYPVSSATTNSIFLSRAYTDTKTKQTLAYALRFGGGQREHWTRQRYSFCASRFHFLSSTTSSLPETPPPSLPPPPCSTGGGLPHHAPPPLSRLPPLQPPVPTISQRCYSDHSWKRERHLGLVWVSWKVIVL